MDIYFDDEYLEQLFQGFKPKGKPLYQETLVKKFKKTVLLLSNCQRMEDLWKFKSLNLERLQGDKQDLYSVRVDIHYRLELMIVRALEGEKFIKDTIHIVCMSNHYA